MLLLLYEGIHGPVTPATLPIVLSIVHSTFGSNYLSQYITQFLKFIIEDLVKPRVRLWDCRPTYSYPFTRVVKLVLKYSPEKRGSHQ